MPQEAGVRPPIGCQRTENIWGICQGQEQNEVLRGRTTKQMWGSKKKLMTGGGTEENWGDGEIHDPHAVEERKQEFDERKP